MNTLYVSGDSFLHRCSARAKLLGLVAAGLLMLVNSPWMLGAGALASAALYATTGLGWTESVRRLKPVALTILVVAVFSFLLSPAIEAISVVFRLVTLVLLAAAVTATTTIGEFVDEITFALGPLERIGLVRASDVGLAVGLVIRFVPDVLARYHAIRDAHQARGLKAGPLTLAVPLIILTLKSADEVAAAIDARGIRGRQDGPRLRRSKDDHP